MLETLRMQNLKNNLDYKIINYSFKFNPLEGAITLDFLSVIYVGYNFYPVK